MILLAGIYSCLNLDIKYFPYNTQVSEIYINYILDINYSCYKWYYDIETLNKAMDI
jgi:hypothetical protein